jgi:AraC family transcriptional activator of pobA
MIAPAEVVRVSEHSHDTAAEGWCVYFPPEIIGSRELGGTLGWTAHPCCSHCSDRGAGGAQRLRVPVSERATWSQHAAALERLLHQPRDGSAEAALAHLTVLLVSAARISVVGKDVRFRREPVLATVFEFVEEHYHEPISLQTVAGAVGLTPGYLATVVRRTSGPQRVRVAHRTSNGRGLESSCPNPTLRSRPSRRASAIDTRAPLHQALPTRPYLGPGEATQGGVLSGAL